MHYNCHLFCFLIKLLRDEIFPQYFLIFESLIKPLLALLIESGRAGVTASENFFDSYYMHKVHLCGPLHRSRIRYLSKKIREF